MASAGKEYLVWLTTNGLVGGTQVAVDYQGDLKPKTGKGNKRTVFKQGQAWTAQSDDGFEFDLPILLAEPAGTALALMLDAHDNATEVYCFVQTSKTGGQRWSGKMKCTMTDGDMSVSNAALATFNFSQSAGTFVRTTV